MKEGERGEKMEIQIKKRVESRRKEGREWRGILASAESGSGVISTHESNVIALAT